MANICVNCQKKIEFTEKTFPVSLERSGGERKPVIGILGGTFDPVHNGHVSLGKAALEQGQLMKLIVMPAKVQPFKLDTKTADSQHRLEMAKLAFSDLPLVEVSDYEIENTNISYTYDTLQHLREEYPGAELAFITGTDAFIEIDAWYKGIDLLESFSFLVSVRPGYREAELEEKIQEYRKCYGTRVEKLLMPMPDVSSTDVRNLCKNDDSITEKVPEQVERYIHEHGLYQ